MNRKVCVVTGSRAEYGLLRWLMHDIRANLALDLQIVATGMHLSPEFGNTIDQIKNDGFVVDHEVEMLLSSDSKIGVAKSFGLAVGGLADSFEALHPDIVLLLGDRFEILAASIAACILRIPIGHLHGGELTEGSLDDSFRHAISKLASLHFTATEQYRRRVIQLGEHPDRVFNVGSPGLENLDRLRLLSKQELESTLGIEFGRKTLLISFHSATSTRESGDSQISVLLNALNKLESVSFIFTRSNADAGGRFINRSIEEFVFENKERAVLHTSLGQQTYLSTLKYVDGIVGNSSSGILEAPSFKIGTVNIGSRQMGRIRAESVIDCEADASQIEHALSVLFSEKFRASLRTVSNPYGGTGVIKNIVEKLITYPLEVLRVKRFFDYTEVGEMK